MGQTTQAGGARQDMRQWVSASWTDLPRGGCSAIDHTTGSCDQGEWVGDTDHFISPVYQEGPGLGGRPWVQPGNYPLCAELKEAQGGTRLAEVLGTLCTPGKHSAGADTPSWLALASLGTATERTSMDTGLVL